MRERKRKCKAVVGGPAENFFYYSLPVKIVCLFSYKKIAPRMHQNSSFLSSEIEKFSGPDPYCDGEGTPSPHTLPPRRLRRLILAPTALDLGRLCWPDHFSKADYDSEVEGN